MSKSPSTIQHHTLSTSNEWYTPSVYIEAARATMGGIDLDPASCELANTVVRASSYYDKETNGLMQHWYGRVWLNPPYGRSKSRSNQDIWSSRLIEMYSQGKIEQAVLLVNANFDTRWFQALWSYPLCFVNHRIDFWSPHVPSSSATHGSVLVYFGTHLEQFASCFASIGTIILAPYKKRLFQQSLEYEALV